MHTVRAQKMSSFSCRAYAIFGNQGEVFSARSRLIVQKEIENDFIKKVSEISKNMQPSDPLNPNSFAGAIVNTEQLEKIDRYVNIGKKEGAYLEVGGNITMKDTGGSYFEPTIFRNVSNDMKIAQEEIFGPVLSTISFSSFKEAILIANDSQYGLAAGVWTKDINKAIYWYKEAAEQNHPMAQHNLGIMYEIGEGVPEDDRKAINW